MNPDIRRLQILNDLVAQTIEALNMRSAAVGGLAHTPYQEVGQTYPQLGAVPFGGVQAQPWQQFGQQIPGQPWPQIPAHLYQQQLGPQVPQQLYPQLGQQYAAGGLPVGAQVGLGQVPGLPFMQPGMRPEVGGLMHSPFVGVPFQPGMGWIDPRLLALQSAQLGQPRYGQVGVGFPYGI